MKYVNALKILRIIRLVTTIVFINEYIKSTSNQFIELYEKLFNLIFKSGTIPEMWVSGTIKPFYKNKGDKFNPKYYRSITMKLLREIIYSSLKCKTV